MCGIGGILRVTPPGEAFEPIPEAWADALDESITHRGPDGHGRFRDKATREDGSIVEVVLVHRRLSIIDHEGGAQPMISESGPNGAGRVAVVFNGCLYNHRELRAELEKRGHVFETDHSDTEVWIHLYREALRNQPQSRAPDFGVERESEHEFWKQTLDTEPDGMYAVAIWDQDRASLSLLHDPNTEKPLYVRQDDQTTVFASTIGQVTKTPCFANESVMLDRDHLADWIALGFHGWATPFGSINASGGFLTYPGSSRAWRWADWLALACILIGLSLFVLIPLGVIRSGGINTPGRIVLGCIGVFILILVAVSIEERWRQRRVDRGPGGLPAVLAPRIDSLLRESVAKRLDADVPVGCFLSGGIDSSLIAKYAHDADPSIKTFCVRMPDERYDESQYAQQVADIIGCEHLTLDVSPEPARDLVHLITELGLPFGDSSILPTYWLCKAAREHVKVALSGDGGDELFVGYERQIAADWLPYARSAGPITRLMRLVLRRSHAKSMSDKAARFLEAGRESGYLDLLAIFPTRERIALLGDKAGALTRIKNFGGTSEAVYIDRWQYLPGDLLRKVDTASMSVGLEVRCPFLAVPLWKELEEIDPRRLAPNGRRKAVLREVAYQYFPNDLVDRPKQGFSIPVGEWFRSDFGGMRTLLHEKLDRDRPFGAAHDVLDFNMDYVRTIIDEHMEQRRDHAQRLFMLTSLAVWSDTLDR